MSGRMIGRRKLLASLAMTTLAAPILQACASTPPAPTQAPAATTAPAPAATTAPAPTTAPAAAATTAAKPTAAPAATATPAAAATPAAKPAAGGTVSLSVAVYPDPNRTWMRNAAQKWADSKGAKVNLRIDDIDYSAMSQKILAELATGTVQDVVFAGIKYMALAAYKGAYLPIDSYVKTTDPGLSDFIPSTMDSSKFEGKMYGLPYEFNTGNRNIIFVNMDMVAQKGAKTPTDDWTYEDFLSIAQKLADSKNGVFGTDLLETTYYDFGCLARAFGGDVMTPDFKQWTFGTDPKSVEAAKYQANLVALKIAPARKEAEADPSGQYFPSGKLGIRTWGIHGVLSTDQQIAGKFKWQVFLPPIGPGGIRGFDSFVAYWLVYAKSKVPETAYELQMALSSKEASLDGFNREGQTPARVSTWTSDDAAKRSPIYAKVGKWISDPKEKGPFQIPDNLRYQELEDMYENTAYSMFYGEMNIDDGIKKVQSEGEKIMAKPRP